MTTALRTITFIDSAYPKPHTIKEFVWSGRLDKNGQLWFDLHLRSADYYLSEGKDYCADSDDEGSDDQQEYTSLAHWQDQIVWDNYHCCTLSSTYWSDDQGILLNTGNAPFDFDNFVTHQFNVDIAPQIHSDEDEDEEYAEIPAFSLYLLGHDECTKHQITFQRQSNNTFHIDWTGKIALTYAGFDEFIHQFIARLENISFDGFYFPKSWDLDKATVEFKKVLSHFEHYEFTLINPKSQIKQWKLSYRGKTYP
ncbi:MULTISPECIES: hypothetical protein [Enterobacterales]|uniref:hypothetical protein n=1 Tax=Enterobacterales TaxID=91347 RepID=UPI0008483295|nr:MULTISPECIES: hypothetical protein [Enterobacterales]WOO50321.1 hypothetical protein R2S03_03805 [Hafnia alvei]MCK9782426.1 hypothetical protein [Proteus columbae]ODQ06413.1 hypothetical protein BGK50_18055 [Shigella sp. FC130]OEI93872.1 hypothetical protein BHE86_17250 [Shigella sp. FC1655]WPF04787.1 hypothetical protein SB028_02655 [Proteus vulgaris]